MDRASHLELGEMALPDLLDGINHQLATNIQAVAPDTYDALLHLNATAGALSDPATPLAESVPQAHAILDPSVILFSHPQTCASASLQMQTQQMQTQQMQTPQMQTQQMQSQQMQTQRMQTQQQQAIDPTWVQRHSMPAVHAPTAVMPAAVATQPLDAVVTAPPAPTAIDAPIIQAQPVAPSAPSPLVHDARLRQQTMVQQQLATQQEFARQQQLASQQEIVRQQRLARQQQLAQQQRQLAQQQHMVQQRQLAQRQHMAQQQQFQQQMAHQQQQTAQRQMAQQHMAERQHLIGAQEQEIDKAKVGAKRASALISKEGQEAVPMRDVSVPSSASASGSAPHVKFAAAQLFGTEAKQERKSQDVGAGPGSSADMEEDQDQRKAMRAERNRQSAAASRERRKHHIRELERRVALLTKENATLQVGELNMLKEKIEQETELVKVNQSLKRDMHLKNMEIMGLSERLTGLNTGGKKHASPKHRKTWDEGYWARRRSAHAAPSASESKR